MLTAYKRCLWFNSDFHSGFVLNDNQKISEISFDVNPFQINVNNNLKVITYIRDHHQSRPIQIKLKEPYNQSREVFNDDNEGFPIIYTNHTGTEGMNTYYPYSVARLVPQQIPRFTFRVDDDYNMIISNSYFTSLTNGDVLPVAKGDITEKFIIFRSSGSFTLTDKMLVDILVVGGGGGGAARHGGGGGAGAVIYLTNQSLISGSYTINIGAGGGVVTAGSGGDGSNGGDTTVTLSSSVIYRAKGGGGGSGGSSGLAGGSTGGSGGSYTGASAAVLTTNIPSGAYGNIGGKGNAVTASESYYGGGGGGGAGSAGGDVSQTAVPAIGGNGGIGREISITGTNFFYGGGGGGGISSNGNTAGTGGLGGGGAGSKGAVTASSGTPNTGGGGGGSGFNGGANGTAGIGGSGVVIIRYREKRNRIEGITPESTLIQATNTNIPITIDSQYQINYQTPVVLPKGTYSATFGNGAISLKSSKSYPILNTNPLVWYKFDDQGNLGLDSAGIYNLSNPNGTSFSTDSISGIGSASFNGTNDHLIKDGSFNLNSKSWSISVWVKRTNNSRQDWLFELGTGYSPQTTLTCGYKADNTISIANYNDDLNTTSTYNDAGTWTHLCFTFLTGTKQVTIYRNGVQIGQKNFTNEFNTNSNFRIAKQSTLYYQGLMDDFRIYQDKVLTPVEVYDLYNGNADRSYPILKDANGVTINPRNWYRFDETNGFIKDGIGLLNLTNNGTTYDSNIFIKGNGSVKFTAASSQYLDMPYLNLNAINIANGISFSMWAKLNTTSGGSARIFDFGTNNTANITQGSRYIYISKNGSGTLLYFAIADAATNAAGNTSESAFATSSSYFDNVWHHIVWTITNTGIWNIYVDNVLLLANSSRKVIPTFNNDSYLHYYFGKSLWTGDGFLDGNIDDFRIYDFVLTATQVAELYNGRLAIYNPPGFILGTEIEPE